MKTDCHIIKELLESYLDNDLSDEKRQDVEKHILECVSCKKELEDLSRLEKLLHAVEFPSISEEVLQTYPQRLESRLFHSFRQKRITRLVLTGGVAAAAASVLITLWVYLQPPQKLSLQQPQTTQIKEEPALDFVFLPSPTTEKVKELLTVYSNSDDESKRLEIEKEIVDNIGEKALNPLVQTLDKRFSYYAEPTENYNKMQFTLDLLSKLITKNRKLGRNDYLINTLVSLLSESSMRTKSVNILAEIAEPRTINYLIKYVDEPNLEPVIFTGVERMGKSAEPYLVRLLYSEDEQIKTNALKVASHFKIKSAVPALVSQLQNRKLRPALIETLGEIGSPEVVIPFFELVKDQSLKPVIDEAIKKIGPDCIPYLEAYLTAIDSGMKCRAIGLITNLQDKKVVPYLIAALPERRVQKAVSKSLQEITGKDFGIDQQKWRQWWYKQTSPKKPLDKNSGITEPDEIKSM